MEWSSLKTTLIKSKTYQRCIDYKALDVPYSLLLKLSSIYFFWVMLDMRSRFDERGCRLSFILVAASQYYAQYVHLYIYPFLKFSSVYFVFWVMLDMLDMQSRFDESGCQLSFILVAASLCTCAVYIWWRLRIGGAGAEEVRQACARKYLIDHKNAQILWSAVN